MEKTEIEQWGDDYETAYDQAYEAGLVTGHENAMRWNAEYKATHPAPEVNP